MTKKIAVVNNRNARGEGVFVKPVINRLKNEVGADVVLTEYAGHAEKIAKESSEYGIIVAVGGDGTVSEVINGMDLEAQKLAVMPRGRGNSLARDLGITSAAKAFDIIKKNAVSKIDLINCRFEAQNKTCERYHIATSGLGFASATVIFANRRLTAAGPFCYTLSGCFKMFGQKIFSAKIKVDNSDPEDIVFTNFFVNNTRHAGNTCVFPEASMSDSRLNLLVTRTNALTQYLWNVGIITRTYFYYPGAKSARRLHIMLHKPSSFMLDGEIFNHVREITYSIVPQKLAVLR